MSNPFIGEIRLFGGNFAPVGWALCSGQLLPISDNTALFSLIGTTYGGDGQTTFALPDLRSRLPLHQGNGPGGFYTIGQTAGVEQVTLSVNQMPQHSHALFASTAGGAAANPTGQVIAASNVVSMYKAAAPAQAMAPQAIGLNGGSQPHSNTQPFLCINFIISLFGVFPSQN